MTSGAPITCAPSSAALRPMRVDIVRFSLESLRANTRWSIRATSTRSPARAARWAWMSAMPSPLAAWAVAVRAKASSVAASVTTRCWIADSRPPEKEKPPIGNIELPNCNRRARPIAAPLTPGSSPDVMNRRRRADARGCARARGCAPALPRRRTAGATRAAQDRARLRLQARTRTGGPRSDASSSPTT